MFRRRQCCLIHRIGICIRTDLSIPQIDDSCGIKFRQFRVMGNHHNQTVFRHLPQQIHNLYTGITVQCSGRLIRKQNLRELCAPLGENFLVIANIPYNITTPIFEALWESGLSIRQISVMIQKEVAEKLMAAPSTAAYGLMSVKCQYYCTPRLECIVPAEKFTPPPKVDSAFVHLEMSRCRSTEVQNERRLFSLLRAGFNLRRKTLSNALRSVVEPDALRAAMEQAEISPTARAEELSVDDWIRLSNACP